jgi:hypothetical protein
LPRDCTCCARRRYTGSRYSTPRTATLPPWPAPPDASFPTLWSLVVAYSRRKESATTWRRRSSSVDRAALGRLPRAPKLGGGVLEEEGERGDLEEEELLGHPSTMPPRLCALPFLAPSLHWRKGGSDVVERSKGGIGRGEKGAMQKILLQWKTKTGDRFLASPPP